ncbi:MAG: GLPGLI family protein [Tannerellaceae bacterium]|jgi:GLPGLI family protein|nr:GLPGLI family protein [Tannerellaceae bacterium]
MKKEIFFLTIVAFILCVNLLQAQTKGELIKVSYITSPLSPSMLSILRKQIPSPEEYQTVVDLISKYKVYHSLYINNKTHESFFIVDSVHAEPGVMVTGNVSYVYTNNEGVMIGKEDFMKSVNIFKSNLSDMKWELNDQTKEINGYVCRNATAKNYPEVSVWFTEKIATNKGPGYFQGLLGLVFEADELFGSTYLAGLEYLEDSFNFEGLIKDYKKEPAGKKLSVKEVLALKDNMMKTAKIE